MRQAERHLYYKGHARIYVNKEEDIAKVEQIIKNLDEYEYGYMPEGFVTTIDQFPKVVYTHKFCDLDMNWLQIECHATGIPIFVFDAGTNDYPSDPRKKDE